MATYSSFSTSFDTFSAEDWQVSSYVNQASWIDTAWLPENVVATPGQVELRLEDRDSSGKEFSGGEFRSDERSFYGTYSVTMQASPENGMLSSFFLYTGAPYGTNTSEIDFEFLGRDTTKVLATFHTPYGSDGQLVDLGFDAADGFHTYTLDWQPDSIAWYADGTLIRAVASGEIGLPSEPAFMFMSLWTGDNSFTGRPENAATASAFYTDVTYAPRTAPVAIDDRVNLDDDGSAVIDVLANDGAMGNTLLAGTVSVADTPLHGTISIDPATGAISYTADPDYFGPDSFTYSVSNGTEISNLATVSVTAGVPIDVDFRGGDGGFVYGDDLFRGTSENRYANGSYEGDGLAVTLGGGNTRDLIENMSGGWSRGFDTVAGQQGVLTLRYRLELTQDLDAGEYAEVLVSLDGTEYSLLRLEATDDNFETIDSGVREVSIDLGSLSAGAHSLTLGGYLNQRTRDNEAAKITFESAVVSLSEPGDGTPPPPPPPSADDDGNLALSAPDTEIDADERGAVVFAVSGLDADATAVVTVTDGAASVSGGLAADGTLTLDLSGLADGALASSVTATDGAGLTATAAGPALTLDTAPPPPSADDDGNLALSAPDTEIDADERGAVVFAVSGLDADATAVVTVTDGAASVSGGLAADGTLTLDLSGLADGALASSVTATDGAGLTATAAGPALTLDTAPPPVVGPTPIDVDFRGGDGGFVYGDDLFRGTSENRYANGSYEGDGLAVTLGGGNTRDLIENMSGGWSRGFDTVAGQQGVLTLRYRLELTQDLDAGEYAEVLVSLDGTEYSLLRLEATDDNFETIDSGVREVSIDLGSLSAGAHSLTLGGYLNQRTRDNEAAKITFESAVVSLSEPGDGTPPPPPPPSADDDGNLALSAPDTEIDADERGAVVFAVSGLDADATAVVTVTDGAASVSGGLAADGTLTLDLSGLADGALASSVTATDGAGLTATAAGPALTLDTAPPPPSADDDGNLALSAPDTEIDADERGAVVFAVSGLDADATAVVTVTDGAASVSGGLAADGTLTLDLSGLADGALASSVTATDGAGLTATAAGPALTLDTAPPPVVGPTPIDVDFRGGDGGFVYGDDLFRGTSENRYANGSYEGDGLAVTLGGGNTRDLIENMSGGWSRGFDTVAGQQGVLTLRYRLELTQDLDAGEYAEVLVSLDGTEYSLLRLEATDDNFETIDSGVREVSIDLGSLSAGAHSLTLGGYLNQRTRDNEAAKITFESAVVSLSEPGDGTPPPPPPPSADDDGNLALSAPDTEIDADERGAVVFAVSGLDADATAVVTVTDGAASVSGGLAADGTLTLDLSGLADGALASSVTATDGAGLTATAAGPALTLDTAPPPVVGPTPIDVDFRGGDGGFVYGDDLFRGTSENRYANGSYEGDGLAVTLGGGNTRDLIENMSGGWSRGFDTVAGQQGVLTLRYRLELTQDLDAGEYAEVLVSLDGTEYSLLRLEATDDNFETIDSGVREVSIDLGSLSAGAHSLTLGGYLNQRTRDNEAAKITFESAVVSLSEPGDGTPPPPPPPSADDDGNLALSAPDTEIDADERGAVVFAVSGLDADATAVVTVTDGAASVSGGLAADGTLTLDLSGLADGALASSVTATDGAGLTATAAGPALTLDTAPPPTGDFAAETRALSIDLGTLSFAYAAKVLPIGDSITHGYLGAEDAVTTNSRDVQDGYRQRLFESLLAQGAFVDYVGSKNSGGFDLIDRDHAGFPGIELAELYFGNVFRDEVVAYSPDVALFMAGTNDIRPPNDPTVFYDLLFPRYMQRLTLTIEQFFSLPETANSHLVISTIPAKPRGDAVEETRMINEGYSIVNGEAVAGDVGNGTYEPGLKAVVAALQSEYPTLHVYDAPFDPALIGEDEVHPTAEGYDAYHAGLHAFLETEIGISGGTLDGTWQNMSPTSDIQGGLAGDMIRGSATANIISGGAGNDIIFGLAGDDSLNGEAGRDRIEGGAGADILTGGADADAFVFNTDFAEGATSADRITDFGNGDDRLYLAEALAAEAVVIDTASGVRINFGSFGTLEVEGLGADALLGADLGNGNFALDTDLVTILTDSQFLV